MKIISLQADNVKRIQAVFIEPSGNVVVIGGKNGAGKSSCLDAIEYALGGDPSAKMPVRRGEEKARIVLDLGDLIVKRTFTAAGGTSLVVTNADGVKQMSPQGILDKLVGKLTFDPLNFARQKPQQQAETMRALVGLDFAALDVAREKLFNERTAVNRDAKALESRIAGIQKDKGLPSAETSTADILAEQRGAAQKNADNQRARDGLQKMLDSVNACTENISTCESNIVDFERKLTEARTTLERLQKDAGNLKTDYENRKAELNLITDTSLDGFGERLAKVESDNAKIRSNRQRSELVEQFKSKSAEADKMTARLEKMDSDKRAATTNAKYPVPGLLFDASGGITLNGIPFEQCSAAEQLKVSIAVGFALNPKLRVLLVRDGSLLDEDSMNVLVAMAKEADAQVWVERVETDAHTSVVIEDGHVQGVEMPATPSDVEQPGVEHQETTAEQPAPDPVKKPSKLKRGQADLI